MKDQDPLKNEVRDLVDLLYRKLKDIEYVQPAFTAAAEKVKDIISRLDRYNTVPIRAMNGNGERYCDLFENANDAVFVVDEHQNYVDANKKALDLIGYSREELLSMSVFDVIPEEQKSRTTEEFLRLRKEGKYDKFRGKLRTKSGRWLNIEVSSSGIHDSGRYAGSFDIVRDISAHIEMEDSLRASESRLNIAQQIAHIGDWEWNVATHAVRWSDELYRIYGYEPGEIQPDYDLILKTMHPASRDQFLSGIDAALKGKRPFEMDYSFFRRDGSSAVIHTISRVIDEAGVPRRMLGTVQDVTTQKNAEDTLRDSEEKFRNIFDSATDGILIADASARRFVDANKSICTMLRCTKEELTRLGIEDIHPSAEVSRVIEEFEKQMRGEKTIAVDIPVLRRDGIVFFADICFTSITLRGNRFSVGIFRDITGRKRAEQALRDSERFIRNILDTVDEGFIVIDRNFRILTANKAYCDQVGEASDRVIGRHCYATSHRSQRPCYEAGEECAVRRVFETGEPHTALHRHTDGKGSILYVETKAFPIKDRSDSVMSVIETVNNITEKHLLEEERLKTQKLEAIGILAGGIAHDFNNLLQGVFGYISMAKTCFETKDRSLAMLEQAEQALHMSVDLTKQLLTFSKGGKPLKKKMQLRSVIENSVKFALSGSRVGYRIELDERLRTVEADEGQIGQVIQNIILNADQAMPLGGTILITAKNVATPRKGLIQPAQEQKYVEISIEDSGIGIPEQYLHKIFDPYFSTKDKGSGLGLATSYSIIKNHGGAIDVVSEPGKGATFFVYLPTVEAEADLPAIRAVSPAVRKGRILVMDDEELIRNIVGEQIKAIGHEVDYAEHGEEAILKYTASLESDSPFDVVILDLTIRGGIGGKETIKRLLDIDPGVKAIVSSGYSDDSVIADYGSYGFSGCLAKPYNFEDLRDTVNALLA